jgi:membrane protein required for colicin V production
MEFNYFDIITATIILLLGLKGILNGFFKELFGLIGIIGGIFIASRAGDKVGEFLNNLIFKFDTQSAISFTGFIATLVVFWALMLFVGFIFKKLSTLSGLGVVDKIFGFIFASGKFFLIAAVIAHAAYNIKSLKTTLDTKLENSILFPVLIETGAYIMKIDTSHMSEKLNDSIDKGTEMVTKVSTENIQESINTKVEEIKKKIAEDK